MPSKSPLTMTWVGTGAEVEVGVALGEGDDSVADVLVGLETGEDVAVDDGDEDVADGGGTAAVTRAIAIMQELTCDKIPEVWDWGLTISVLTRACSIILAFEIAGPSSTATTKACCYTLAVLYTCLRTHWQTLRPQASEVASVVVGAAGKCEGLGIGTTKHATIIFRTSECGWAGCGCAWRAWSRSRFASNDYHTGDAVTNVRLVVIC